MDAGGRAMQEQLSRRIRGCIAGYVTLFTTQKRVKKTSKLGIFFALKKPKKQQCLCGEILTENIFNIS
jgi:hypothetical protein